MKSHFIFYKINKKENVIKIIRSVDLQMDVENRFNY